MAASERPGISAAAICPAAAGSGPAFTVFTPTYNRAHTLHRVFESLSRQSFNSFEWLVVDDGSTDDTEHLVADWSREAAFPVRYERRPHGGKHAAFNFAVSVARGLLLVPLDSDDACIPDALASLWRHWTAIPDQDREVYAGIWCLCVDQHGRLVGDTYPAPVVDGSLLDMVFRLGIQGEKWPIYRTDVLRKHPFPHASSSTYVPECTVWYELGRKYIVRFINEPLRVYWMRASSDQLTQRAAVLANAEGCVFLHRSQLNFGLPWFRHEPVGFLRAAAQYGRLSLLAGRGVLWQVRGLNSLAARALWLTALPVGAAVALRDLVRARRGAQPW